MISDFLWHENPILEIDPVNEPHRLRVWRDFRVSFKLDGRDTVLTIPAGTLTDFASVPTLFQNMFPSIATHMAAAVVHDYLCISKMWTHRIAAEIFLEAMRASRTPEAAAIVMYQAVLFGGPKWR